MKIIQYEDNSWCINIGESLISDSTLLNGFASLHTTTDFERLFYLTNECGLNEQEARELLKRYKKKYEK